MERHMRLSRAAVVLVAIALIAAIAAAVWFASPESPYVPSEDSGAALGTAAPAEDGYAEHETTVPGGYTPVRSDSDVDNMRSNGRKSNNKYILMGNITIDSIDLTAWTGEDGSPWKSELDGNGYTITINAATASGEYYDTGGLFSVIGGGAYVHDLTIVVQNVRVDNTANEGNANFGVIAGNACGAVTVDNVYIRLDKDSSNNGDAYVSSNRYTWLGGVFGKVEGSGVSIKNTTVYNAAAGSRGFSGTMVNNFGVYVGGFVGSIDKGDLTVSNIAYKADDNAKIFAVAESGAGWTKSNTTLTGGVLGYHNEGSFTLDGLIFDAKVSLDSNNNPNFGTQNGNSPHAAYIVGQVDGGLSDVWSDIYINAANGSDWLDGNNQERGTFISYDATTFTDARFTDDEKIAFAVARQNPASAGSVVRTIVQENTTTTLSDAEIADIVSSGDGPAWITVDRVNATGKNSLSIGSKATTGTYSVQNYDAVSSAGDSAYLGSKVYDGTAVKTPTLNVGDATVNAWTADSTSTTADAGTKTFSYNEDALSGYATATYNGGTYLVRGGTIYSPGKIIVNGEERPFALGKDFVYEITKAPVEVVVANIPGTFYDGDPMPKLTVLSVTPNVPGQIKWKDSSLVYGKNEYGWTWTPEDDNNYQPDTGTVMLEVSQATINEIVVSGDFETQYTAYDAFDPDGMVVTAHYQNGDQKQVPPGDLSLTVNQGSIDRLVVASTTVTVTYTDGDVTQYTEFTIEVSPLEVVAPTAKTDLVYNGAEQAGVEASADGYYFLSGNTTATNAGDYVATATLTDPDNTCWNIADADDTTPKKIGWSIIPMTIAGTVSAAGSLEYDGTQKNARFEISEGKLFGDDAVTIDYTSGDRVNVTDDGFTATAQLPNNGNYKWETDAPSASFTVTPKPVVIGVTGDRSKTYDGQEVDPDELFTAPQGVGGGELALTVAVDGGKTILNAGSYTVTAVLAQGQPNYTAEQAVAKYSVSKADPTVNPTADVQGALYTSDDLYEIALNLGEQDTPGTVSWDEGQRLTADEQEYRWTFVPTDEVNYNGKTGVIRLTAEQAQLVSVTVDVMPDMVYTAFDAFDPEGMVVTAHYQNNDTKQVALNDLSLTVDQGSIDRLVVASTTVTVTYTDGDVTQYTEFTIEVSPLEVVAPTAKTDLVYNGAEQAGVEASADGYYLLSGNTTATYAGDYVATATLTDKANTEWEGGSTDDVSIAWTIAQMTLDGTVLADSLEYDGNAKEAAFDLTTGTLFGSDQVTIVYGGADDRTNVTGEAFTATAQLPSSGNYKWATDAPSASFTVTPMPVVIGVTGDLSKTYDGQAVDPDELFTAPQGVGGGALTLTVTVDGGEEILNAGSYTVTAVLADGQTNYTAQPAQAKYEIAKVVLTGTLTFAGTATYDGTQKTATFKLTSDNLVGQDSVGEVTYNDVDRINVTGQAIVASVALPNDNNYAWASTAPSATFTISPKAVEIESIQELTKTYDGNVVDPKSLFIAPDGVGGGALELTVTVDGGKTILNAGSYTVTAKPTSANYAGACEVNYIIQKASPSVTVKVDTDTTYYSSQSLYNIAIEAEEPSVAGKIAWEEGQVLSAATTEYSWVFTPDDDGNYEIVTGKVTLKVENVTLNRIVVTKNPDKMSYVAYSDFDATGMIVTAYFDGDEARELDIEELTLSDNTNLQYGNGKATITITFQEKTATVTVDVTKMLIPVPQAQTGLVYDGTAKVGVTGGDGYTLSGDTTATNAGDYTATATLTDKNNTVWADGSVDDITITWTIREPVTSDEVIADILAMEKVTWQNAEEFLDLEARYNALDKSEQTAEATAKLEVLRAQYDALRNAAFDDIKAAHEVTAKSLGKALAAAAAGLSAAAIALAIAKRRSI